MRIGINQFCFPAPCDVSEALHRAKGLGYDCMEICLTADRKPGPAVGSVTDALDISGYFNRLLHEQGRRSFSNCAAWQRRWGFLYAAWAASSASPSIP